MLRDDLIAARALIDTPEKWGKGWGTERRGRECAATACVTIIPYGNGLSAMLDALRAQSPMPGEVWNYNDDPSTTHADIMALFDRAIQAATPEPENKP